MKTVAAATIASASQMGRARGNVGSWNKWQQSRVSLSPTLGAGKGVNYLLPFAGCLCWAKIQRVVTSWVVESGALCSSPSFAIYYSV